MGLARRIADYAKAVFVDSSSNVGIGNTSPVHKLDVAGTGQVQNYLRITNSGGGQRLLVGNQDSGGVDKPAIFGAANSAIAIGYGNSWSGDGGTLTTLFRINGTGTSNDFESVLAGGTTLYPAFFPRAFVAINQQGTQSILASGNVSSISDDGTGLTKVNFITHMPNTNYSIATGYNGSGVITGAFVETNTIATSSFILRMNGNNGGSYDFPLVSAAVFR